MALRAKIFRIWSELALYSVRSVGAVEQPEAPTCVKVFGVVIMEWFWEIGVGYVECARWLWIWLGGWL